MSGGFEIEWYKLEMGMNIKCDRSKVENKLDLKLPKFYKTYRILNG